MKDVGIYNNKNMTVRFNFSITLFLEYGTCAQIKTYYLLRSGDVKSSLRILKFELAFAILIHFFIFQGISVTVPAKLFHFCKTGNVRLLLPFSHDN